MSGIYNIGHSVMPWWISNCEQGSGTCLFLWTQHHNPLHVHKDSSTLRQLFNVQRVAGDVFGVCFENIVKLHNTVINRLVISFSFFIVFVCEELGVTLVGKNNWITSENRRS